jgi:4-amino-4-deoxy-L-arabinose transferase-like glycosyltransferase
LRIYKLGTIPPHLTSDEASLGYNAYSILKTGKDEYGTLLPIIFKSFGDWKPGLYVYSAIPTIAILGLNEFAVRLPSAIAGIVAVWLIYKIVEILSHSLQNDKKSKSPVIDYKLLPSISAVLLAINPWHLHFSRGAWEANLSLTLTLAGTYFFLKCLTKNTKYLMLSSIFFALTLITYQGAKLSSLIVVILLALVYRKKLYQFIREDVVSMMVSLIVGLVISLPVLFSIFQGKSGRLEVFSVFSYPRSEEYVRHILDQGGELTGSFSSMIYHSEGFNFARAILGRWFNHFSGRFLFFEGDWPNPRHSAPNHGMLMFWELLLLPAGFFALLRKRLTKEKLFVLLWLILAPLPSILSRDEVHAVRAYNLVIPLSIVSAFGLFYILNRIDNIRKQTLKVVTYLMLALMFVGSFAYYLDAYFVHLPQHNSKQWEYGQKQVVETILSLQNEYEEIKIQQSFAQPYIYYLFYSEYDPGEYQRQANLIESEYKFDVGYIERIDNIHFAPIDWPRNRQEKGTVVVADNIRIPPEEVEQEGARLIKEIKYLDENTAYYVVEVL